MAIRTGTIVVVFVLVIVAGIAVIAASNPLPEQPTEHDRAIKDAGECMGTLEAAGYSFEEILTACADKIQRMNDTAP